MEEDSFDPLDFISKQKITISEDVGNDIALISDTKDEQLQNLGDLAMGDLAVHDLAVHVLDLPPISRNFPGEIIMLLLKLLAPDPIMNFGGTLVETETKTLIINDEEIISSKLKSREIDHQEFSRCLPWFENNAPTLLPGKKLALIFENLNPENLNHYLTNIISSSLDWIPDDLLKEKIWKEASLRLSENCGRTAQPEIIRKIVMKGFPEKTGKNYIQLKEPSLTSDNLGLKTWGSSLMLSQRLVSNHQNLLFEPILELGAGTGLVGITCALLGYENIFATDLPEIIENLSYNIQLNDISSNCIVEALDWSNSKHFQDLLKQKYGQNSDMFNTLILSDPIYSSKHPQWVINMIEIFLKKTEISRVLLQIPIRTNFEEEREMLWKMASDIGLHEVQFEIERGYDDFGKQKFIFKEYRWSNL
ncbi:hypothetical protein PACTADRAFT_48272 [Pachysolen tannophilus NRRL Y-2460]|uniref:Uncharacterized protein n=1 Tax=Pachysolen tannophilus NRRL Y-2460 TaxID=669874 RepID=A0A1E4U3F3_PACTA|nr:hypothetical protein PACTADRAFT_48272 [Pachysolen tannophilus NRRL Y-2460]